MKSPLLLRLVVYAGTILGTPLAIVGILDIAGCF